MRFRLWEIILFAVLIALTVVFGLLKSVWAGFAYFSATTIFALAIVFIVNRILYLLDLKKDYDENLGVYMAELLNNDLITREQYYNQDPKVVKGYYKSYGRTKSLQILIIVILCLVLIGVCVTLFTV